MATEKPAAGGKSPTRRWVLRGGIAVVAIGVAAAILIPTATTRREILEACASCSSRQTTVKSGLWWAERRLLDRGTVTALLTTEVATDILGPSHRHRWLFKGCTNRFLGLQTGIICSEREMVNPLAQRMASDPALRKEALARVESGAMDRGDLVRVLELPASPHPGVLRTPEHRRLYELGLALLEVSDGEGYLSWARALEETRRDLPLENGDTPR